MSRLLILVLCLSWPGCAGLIVRDDDSVPGAAGKVVVRALLAIPTLGISEATLVDLKDEERNSAWRKQHLPESEQACLREWGEYLADRDRKRLFEGLPHLMVSVVAQDYLGGVVPILNVSDLVAQRDALLREWQRTLATEPQAALLSECSRRFALRRFFRAP